MYIGFLILNFLVAASVNGQIKWPSDIRNGNYEDIEFDGMGQFLRGVLENFRLQMKGGIPLIKLPPADPLNMKNEKIHVRNDQVELDLDIHEINIVGLSGFQVEKLKANLNTLTVDAGLQLPNLVISGSYNLTGKFFKLIPLYGTGNYEVKITAIQIGAKTSLTTQSKQLIVSPLELNLQWDQLDLDLGDFLGGGDFGSQIQKMLPGLGKTFFQEFKPKIMALASRGMTKLINSELQKDSVRNVLITFIPGIAGRLGF